MNFKSRYPNCTYSVCEQSADHANPRQISWLKCLTAYANLEIGQCNGKFQIRSAIVDKSWQFHLRVPGGAAFRSRAAFASSACWSFRPHLT